MTATLIQEMRLRPEPPIVESSASAAECYVCGRGFDEDHCITAKTMIHGTFMLCDEHYSLRWIVRQESRVTRSRLAAS